MAVHQTYLFTPPEGETNPYGAGIFHSEFISKLKLCNGAIVVPTPEQWGERYYPGKEMGVTSIWLGNPGQEWAKKITAITLGLIPEWTAISPTGDILRKGWRAVLKKCIMAHAFTKEKAETVFKVNLETSGKSNLCDRCAADGVKKLSTSASKLCETHESVRKVIVRNLEDKKEREWLSLPSTKTRLKASSSRLILSLR